MATKRDLKENFVSGWGGTTLTEINVISCTPDIALSIFNLLILNNSRLQDRAILLSFLLLVAPMVFQLLGPLSPVWVFIGLLMCLVLLMGQLRKFSKLLRHQYDWEMGLKQSLTIHRAFVMLITCVAILAVDFRAFPRRLAKTEFFGTGKIQK